MVTSASTIYLPMLIFLLVFIIVFSKKLFFNYLVSRYLLVIVKTLTKTLYEIPRKLENVMKLE